MRHALLTALCLAALPLTLAMVQEARAAAPTPVETAVPTLTATSSPVPTPPAAHASLQLSPTHGQVTQSVSILGEGFAPGVVLIINLDGARGSVLATSTADADGYLSGSFTLPEQTSLDAHQIVAVGTGHVLAATLYTVDPVPPPCTGFTIVVPLIGNVCLDISQLVTDVLNATFGSIAGMFSGAWDGVTSTFQPALIVTPNFASDPAWTAFQTFVTTLQYMWGTTFVAMFVFGMFARYMEGIGAGSFGGILGIVGRAIMLTAFLALYNPIMANWVFPAENGLASAIISANIPGTSGGLDAIGKALATVSTVFSLTSVLNLLILLIALVVGVLCVVVRDMGLGVLAALYIVGPLALITWLSPQFDFIARWWLRTLINVLLWPVGYALALKVGSALLGASGWTGSLASLGALGCLMLLYRVPSIIGSMAGSDGVTGAVTLITDRGMQYAAMAAKAALKGK